MQKELRFHESESEIVIGMAERYVRSLEGKGVEWDGDDNVEHM